MVPFERAFVSFYRPSIVTFPLSLRVSEIRCALDSAQLNSAQPNSAQLNPAQLISARARLLFRLLWLAGAHFLVGHNPAVYCLGVKSGTCLLIVFIGLTSHGITVFGSFFVASGGKVSERVSFTAHQYPSPTS